MIKYSRRKKINQDVDMKEQLNRLSLMIAGEISGKNMMYITTDLIKWMRFNLTVPEGKTMSYEALEANEPIL